MATDIPFPKPVPLEDADQQPYWRSANDGELTLQKCNTCAEIVHPPGPGCPWCGGDELGWISLGRNVTGTVYSFIVVHRAFLRSFVDDVPYVVALVDVDGAPRIHITGNITDVSPEDVSIGMRVRMIWEERSGEQTVPQWAAT